MPQVLGELVAGEAPHVMAHDHALAERLVHGHGDASTQLGLANEEQAEPALRVHLLCGARDYAEHGHGVSVQVGQWIATGLRIIRDTGARDGGGWSRSKASAMCSASRTKLVHASTFRGAASRVQGLTQEAGNAVEGGVHRRDPSCRGPVPS